MKRILTIIMAALLCKVAFAQTIQDDDIFRKGRLSNGMTYYLCHNEEPEGCADFYIAHNVGALQEEDKQNGLAHFLEHMAFNGTRHFPDKSLLEFLASEGVRFGYNVNAYTSRNETVYNISSVPLVRESFVDSVLLILHDWSCDISCEQDALDAERGVIREEWRLRDEQRFRMNSRQTEAIYRGAKHPQRTVLGTLEVIDNFKREEILDFYHRWYRPDLQAIIIVGDFDVDEMETRVKNFFSDIPRPENAVQKPDSYLPPAQDGPLFADQTDQAIRYRAAKMIYKQAYPSVSERRDEEFYRDLFCREIVTTVLGERLRSLQKEDGCALQSGVAVTMAYKPDYYISLVTLAPREQYEIAEAFEAAEREIHRLLTFGMSEQEIEAARLQLVNKLHLNRVGANEEVRSEELVRVCIENFLRGTPCISPTTLAGIQAEVLSGITPEHLASYPAKVFLESEKIYSSCYNSGRPELAPSADSLRAILSRVDSEQLEPRFQSYPAMDLSIACLDSPRTASEAVAGAVSQNRVQTQSGAVSQNSAQTQVGTVASRRIQSGIVSRSQLAPDIQKWKLSNGATVWYRKTEKECMGSHSVLQLRFRTGYRAAPAGDIAAFRYATSYCRRIVGFRGIEKPLQKNYPEMNDLSVLLDFKDSYSEISITAGAKKTEDMFRVAWLQLNEPEFGSAEMLEKDKAKRLADFAKKRQTAVLYKEALDSVYYGANPWTAKIDSAAIDAVGIDFLKESYINSFGDMDALDIIICSDRPQEEIEAGVEKYLAPLATVRTTPKTRQHLLWQSYKGKLDFYRTEKAVSAPLSDVCCLFSFGMKRNARNLAALDVIDYLMSARYLALIREERGGAYHVSFKSTDFQELGRPFESTVTFRTRPSLSEILVRDVYDEMDRMSSAGPSDEEVDRAVRYLLKHAREQKKKRDESVTLQFRELRRFVLTDVDYHDDYEQALLSLTPSYIRKIARKIASGDSLTAVYTEN